MFEQNRWTPWAAVSLITGVLWLTHVASLSLLVAAPGWVVGGVFLAAGISQLVWPGDVRINQTAAFVGLIAAVLALPYGLALGFVPMLLLSLGALATLWTAGRVALILEPHCEGVPAPEISPALSAKVAIDEVVLGLEQWSTSGFSLDGTLERVVEELDGAHAFFGKAGWLDKPDLYHPSPPAISDPEIRIREVGGHQMEELRFESGYAPAEGEPGRERWLGYDACREGWAYVLRHPGPARPWMICTNGYRMGHARIDVGLFERFFRGNGVNVLIPVLPLHGPRRVGFQSGSGFLGIDILDTVHAEAQAMWDMQRLLGWVRDQGAPAVGAFGLSLGGFTTALFSSVADGLACSIPGIPLTDVSRIAGRHLASHQLRYAESRGFDLARVAEVMGVVSPLRLRPRVPHSGRLIFGAVADRLVPAEQVRDLWRHWEEPEIVWYQGGHCTFMSERPVWNAVDRTLRDAGLVPPAAS